MCGGGRRRRAAKAAAKEQARLDALATENQKIINTQNQTLIDEQEKQEIVLADLETKQAEIIAQQETDTANFETKKAEQEAYYAEEKAKIEQQNLVNQSVSQSLQVLATKDKKKKKAPMAGKDPSRKGEGNQARYNSPTKNLKVGISKEDSGVGVNLGG